MNDDQKLVATIGLVLILLVIFGTYRATLSAILFDAPPSTSSGAAPLVPPSVGTSPSTPDVPDVPELPVVPVVATVTPGSVSVV